MATAVPRRADARPPAWRARARAWWAARSAFAQDALLALVAFTVGTLALLLEPENAVRGVLRPADPLAVALVVGMTLPLAWRRRAPLLALVVPAACTVVTIERGYAAVLTAFFVLFGIGSAARYTDRRTAVALGVLAAAVALAVGERETGGAGLGFVGVVAAIMIGATPAVVGDAFRVQAELTATIRERALALDRMREAEVHAAITEERVGMARDIHDIVGHHLSAISLHSGAARRVLGRDPDGVERSLGHIAQLTADALAETRRMLDVLRTGEAELAPSPGLADLPALAERASAGGVPTELRVEGTPGELTSGVETCTYRIVQEALTNVARHARPAHATVVVRHEPRRLVVEVDDDGRPSRAPAARAASGGPGNGLIGMRERAGLVGGTVEAGPRTGGGWRVRAVLPTARSA